jgi:PhnB protein
MQLTIYLTFAGQCEAAFKHYEKCLGGAIVFMMKYRDSPAAAETPSAWHDKVYHATFNLGSCVLSGADVLPAEFQRSQCFSVLLAVDDPAEADRIFEALSEGGDVQMPLAETTWALRFGMLTDRFGIPWTMNCGKPITADESP